MSPLFKDCLDCHLGRVHLLLDRHGALVRLDFGIPPLPSHQAAYQQAVEDRGLSATARQQLHEYFDGARQAFDLPLAPVGSAFLRAAWARLAHIPYGTTTTYGALARAMGTSARAIGMANALNPISIVVPCHRVIAADGSLSGYSGGLDKKHGLLLLEAQHAGQWLWS
ncbi:methylated-DNA--[protein]-cysteine S-methyltransferase [Pseudomonas sp. ABC1]|uniref:methylated-DNA--[protein]-cysteine S-methyltransferase n=1 Tax=Pseudomonas sp. ABC1 TaxID=2748080 RepID=UPI0015C398ED|nr:methylated-DNA--[protein]-cysteine S-methyltransferase [Pseudomonas sp. ABC1]QLF93949.1 methylated-DNA--[protein]-cysteine S-methyltransferase [Pseudomonas sp. ABC1]